VQRLHTSILQVVDVEARQQQQMVAQQAQQAQQAAQQARQAAQQGGVSLKVLGRDIRT